ncbi:MAG: TIGR00341 family protein [Planctomycetota bacterium]|jgi:uncharacterized hydrophobic protein (TIGR00341 family)
MAERLIKIILPENLGTQAQDLLKGKEGLRFWQEGGADDQAVFSVLVDAEQSEEVMDRFNEKFAHVEGFHLVLLAVEASVPRIPEADGDEQDKKAPEQKNLWGLGLRVSREELYADIKDNAVFTGLTATLAVLSTIVAAIGLMRNNVAVIIGAMVIAPFLGPNVAIALSFTLADFELGKKALKALVLGVSIAFVMSFCMGVIFQADPQIPEISSRTVVSMSDILLALASGCAGVLAFTSALSSAVIGVMVALSLLPPLAVFGLMLGSGWVSESLNALLLFVANIICVNLAGIIAFFIQGVSPRTWWESNKAKRATRIGITIWLIMLIVLVVLITVSQ